MFVCVLQTLEAVFVRRWSDLDPKLENILAENVVHSWLLLLVSFEWSDGALHSFSLLAGCLIFCWKYSVVKAPSKLRRADVKNIHLTSNDKIRRRKL